MQVAGKDDDDGSYWIDYLVKRTNIPWKTRIFSRGQEVGKIIRGEELTYILIDADENQWVIDPRVHGEIQPFSLTITKAGKRGGKKRREEDGGDEDAPTVLTIRNNLFKHDGRFYMFTSIPEGRLPSEFLIGHRYICRLDTFPFADLLEIDSETLARLRRFRGVPVGELGGRGGEEEGGHAVRLSRELEDIALPLAASSYLLYSTA